MPTSSSQSARPSRGATGGAANEAGSAFRKRVAAWILCHGLTDSDFPDLGLPMAPGEGVPIVLDMETDAHVDDIYVQLSGGGRLYMQAKRSLTLGKSGEFAKGVAQFCRFVDSAALDPNSTRLVLACQEASGPVRALQQALERGRSSRSGSYSRAESDALAVLDGLISSLRPEQQQLLQASMAILIVNVEHDGLGEAGVGESLIADRVVPSAQARSAWNTLQELALKLAQKREGVVVEDAVAELRHAGLSLIVDRDGVRAARIEARRIAIEKYRGTLSQPALSLLALAAIPPIPLDELHVKISVQPISASGDEGSSGDLIEKVVRRGRVLLTGLPGSGKTTALRLAAAAWASRLDWPCPILVDLKSLNIHRRQNPAASPLDALVAIATSDGDPGDKDLVAEDFRRRAVEGDLCLFLDSLDETRTDRWQMIEYLQRLVGQLHPDVEMVVATRGVGYADAHTLGFRDLRLVPPANMMPAVRRVLEEAANLQGLSGPERDQWVRERARRIRLLLAGDPFLEETPLIPVLMAVLAASDPDALNANRAAILVRVIEAAARRWEMGRREGHADISGGLGSAEVANALLESFEVLSGLVLSSPAVSFEAASNEVEALLESRYGVPSGRAHATAEGIVHFWDESGTLVIAPGGTLAPRLELFAEIGAARAIAGLAEQDQAGVVSALAAEAGRDQVLLLAAELAQGVLEQLVRLGSSGRNVRLLLLAARAMREGAEASQETCDELTSGLLGLLRDQEDDVWTIAKATLDLPLSSARQSEVFSAFNQSLSPDLLPIGLALGMKKWRSTPEDAEKTLRGFLLGDAPPFEARRHWTRDLQSKRRIVLSFEGSIASADYAEAYVYAAQALLPDYPECAEAIAEVASKFSGQQVETLLPVLREIGRPDLADKVHEEVAPFMHWPEPGPIAWWDALFRSVGQIGKQVPLNRAQERRMDELADLVATLEIPQWPAGALRNLPREDWLSHYEAVVEAASQIGGFDIDVLASEAMMAEQRFRSDQLAGISFFFDAGRSRDLVHWADVADESSVREKLVQSLSAPFPLCALAARCLWEIPNPPDATALIEAKVDLVSLDHPKRSIVARLLLHLDGGDLERTKGWMTAGETVLRAEAAGHLADLVSQGVGEEVESLLVESLSDRDAGVLEMGLESLTTLPAPLAELVNRIAVEEPGGFGCRFCGELNEPHQKDCGSCGAGAPDPRPAANRLLKRASP